MDEIEQLICDCEEREEKLTPWELTFIASIRDKYDRDGVLSDNQEEKLNQIWERIT